jgi:hypothetical protein
MTIGRRKILILGAILLAVASIVVVGSIQGTQQRELMERSFVDLGRFPDAVAVYKLHGERQIRESYVTPHSDAEIRAYYDQRLSAMGWQGPGPEWTADGWVMRCYIDPTGRVTAIISTELVPRSGTPAFTMELTRNGCTGLQS